MVLIVGSGNMAKEYVKVLVAQNIDFRVVGRSQKSADKFSQEVGVQVAAGGIDSYLKSLEKNDFSHAIVATGIEQLANTTKALVNFGIKDILVEKPGGLTLDEIQGVSDFCVSKGARVYVAYNRRFYASAQTAKKLIKEDGGVKSFNFELTEWGHVIKDNPKGALVKENWFMANTSHVADMAYFLGGFPQKISCFYNGGVDWHKRSHNYSGAGVSESGALFSYHGNWVAPGRWSVEVLTSNYRLIFRPMEKLQLQKLGSVRSEFLELDDALDIDFKPGLYRQVAAFLNSEYVNLCKLNDHVRHVKIYCEMAGYN